MYIYCLLHILFVAWVQRVFVLVTKFPRTCIYPKRMMICVFHFEHPRILRYFCHHNKRLYVSINPSNHP